MRATYSAERVALRFQCADDVVQLCPRHVEFSAARFAFASPRVQLTYRGQVRCFQFGSDADFEAAARCVMHLIGAYDAREGLADESTIYSYSYSDSGDDLAIGGVGEEQDEPPADSGPE